LVLRVLLFAAAAAAFACARSVLGRPQMGAPMDAAGCFNPDATVQTPMAVSCRRTRELGGRAATGPQDCTAWSAELFWVFSVLGKGN